MWVKVIENIESFTFPNLTSKKVIIDNEAICLSKVNGLFYAISDKCPHDGGPMSAGSCFQNTIIECPWHHFRFSLTDGKSLGNKTSNIRTYNVKIENNQLFIEL